MWCEVVGRERVWVRVKDRQPRRMRVCRVLVQQVKPKQRCVVVLMRRCRLSAPIATVGGAASVAIVHHIIAAVQRQPRTLERRHVQHVLRRRIAVRRAGRVASHHRSTAWSSCSSKPPHHSQVVLVFVLVLVLVLVLVVLHCRSSLPVRCLRCKSLMAGRLVDVQFKHPCFLCAGVGLTCVCAFVTSGGGGVIGSVIGVIIGVGVAELSLHTPPCYSCPWC